MEQKNVSLNLEQRLARKKDDDDFKKTMDDERDRLAKINYVEREVKLDSVIKAEVAGVKPAEETKADGDTDAEDGESKSKFDIHLRETLRVVSDALHLTDNPLAWTGGRPPATPAGVLNKG